MSNCPIIAGAIADLDAVTRALRQLKAPFPHPMAPAHVSLAYQQIGLAQIELAKALVIGVDPILEIEPSAVLLVEPIQ